jgi:replicative DNA helicase
MNAGTKEPWIHISDANNQGLAYMEGRRTGEIRSVLTPWDRMNKAGIDGFEFGTIIGIGARPATGKTLLVNRITRESFRLNPGLDHLVLDFQWEMLARTNAIRDASANLKRTINELCSAEGICLSDEMMDAAKRHYSTQKDLPIYIVEKPMTVAEFKNTIIGFYQKNKKKFIVTLDHTLLTKKAATERDKFEMLNNLLEAMTELKKVLPVMFIVLSQLNRDIEDTDRLRPGTVGNYVLPSDIFGGDALLQHCDILIGINRPANLHIPFYGPERYKVDENLLAFHFLKVRNGSPRLSFFRAEFEHMNIIEIEPPLMVPKKL